MAYAVLLNLAALCHYSAALAIAAFSGLIAYDGLNGSDRAAWKRLVSIHLIPVLIFAGLYATQVRTTLESDLMGLAFRPEGWLSAWLVTSPADAWNSIGLLSDLSPAARLPSAVNSTDVGGAYPFRVGSR